MAELMHGTNFKAKVVVAYDMNGMRKTFEVDMDVDRFQQRFEPIYTGGHIERIMIEGHRFVPAASKPPMTDPLIFGASVTK